MDTELAAPRRGRTPIQVSDPFDCPRVPYLDRVLRVPDNLLQGLSNGNVVLLREADLIVENQARFAFAVPHS